RSAGIAHARAAAFVSEFGRRQARDYPAADAGTNWRAVPIDQSFLPPDANQLLALLIGLSAMVLLIACSNLANLFLARTMARAREFAVRSALGASRSQVLRPLLLESLLIALAGGLCSLLVANWTFRWLAAASAEENGVGVVLGFDWRVLGWACLASLFTALA